MVVKPNNVTKEIRPNEILYKWQINDYDYDRIKFMNK